MEGESRNKGTYISKRSSTAVVDELESLARQGVQGVHQDVSFLLCGGFSFFSQVTITVYKV